MAIGYGEAGRSARIVLRMWASALALLLVAYAGLVGWTGLKNSPSPDETAHLAAGIAAWKFDRLDLYPVNPPLVQSLAAAPVLRAFPDGNWSSIQALTRRADQAARPEWSVGIGLVRDNAGRAMWFFTLARWACIPLCLIGGFICWRWAGELYGPPAGLLALVLWVFSPNVLAWSATICPDAAAASLGLAACYLFWRWLKKPDWLGAMLAGVALGLAELTKMTWIILFGVWPLLWLIWLWNGRKIASRFPDPSPPFDKVTAGSPLPQGATVCERPRWPTQAMQLLAILFLGLCVLNLGYSCEGTFSRLGDYTFVSRTLAGSDSVADGGQGGNRFTGTWLQYVPVPLPWNYVRGADLQKLDFERGLPSYLFGNWQQHGWWYYYIVCAALKEPLGVWLLVILAVGLRIGCVLRKRWGGGGQSPFAHRASQKATVPRASQDEPVRGGGGQSPFAHRASQKGTVSAASQNEPVPWLDEVVLLLPAICLFVFVSSQTGFSCHFRYVLPALPFIFIWISRVAQAAVRRPRTIGVCVVGATLWMIASSLSVWPHSMSYFNELAGGPMGGPRYLLDSNVDWGQDVMYLKDWCESHPESAPLNAAFENSYSDSLLGLGERVKDFDAFVPPDETEATRHEIAPGWWAVTIGRIYDSTGPFKRFLQFKPVAMSGYSIYIYHLTPDDVRRIESPSDEPRTPAK